MKTLTIKQPWASLIIEEHKKYEFRTWKTKYRGKILIHAGQSYESKYSHLTEHYNLELSKGEIIGEATIIDCILVDKEFSKDLNKINPLVYHDNYENIYAWKLTDVIKYDKPIKVKGKLGLWNYED